MATINQSFLSLSDAAKRTAPDGSLANVVEMMMTSTPALEDIPFRASNLPTGHQVTTRTGLPSVSARRLNEGVAASKSRTDQFTETFSMLSSNSQIDAKLVEAFGPDYRASEEKPFQIAMGRAFEDMLFYGSSKTNPEKFHGLAPRMDSISASNSQVIPFGAASGSDSASIWCIGWGDPVYGIYPKDSTAGLKVHDMGEQWTPDTGGTAKFRAYVTSYEFDAGIVVADSRYVVRLCNIDDDVVLYSGNALITAMVRMVNQMQDLTSCRPVIYMPRAIRTYLHVQSLTQTANGSMTFENVGGKIVSQFMGIPVKVADSLLFTEAALT